MINNLKEVVDFILENDTARLFIVDAIAGVEGKYPDTWENKEVSWDQILVESLEELKLTPAYTEGING